MSTSTAPRPASRLVFVDWLRAWALLVMVETHVFNAFLDVQFRSTPWFRALNFVNGLVAPSFLFVSGFVFLVSAQKRLPDLRSFGRPFWKQAGRVAMVCAVGYLMHLPSYSPLRLPSVTASEWRWFYRADVLHCISVTWLFLLTSLAVIRSERWLRLWLCGWAAALSALAPMVWSIDFYPSLAAPLAAYLNAKTGSLFPLFPWSAFMLAGAACASWFLEARRAGRERTYVRILALAGVAGIGLGYLTPPWSFLPQAVGADWWADPRTLLVRLGIVLLLLNGCYWYGQLREPRNKALLDVSRESLFVYVVHLLVIYGPFWGGRSAADVIGKAQGPIACLASSLALALLMIGGARIWGRIKRK